MSIVKFDKKEEIADLAEAVQMLIVRLTEVIDTQKDVKRLCKEMNKNKGSITAQDRAEAKNKIKKLLIEYIEKNSATLFGGSMMINHMVKSFIKDIP